MADLSKIKVGDCIKFTARVVSVTEGMVGITRPEAEDKSSQLYLGGRWIEAAEHIPAPREFKRGDWVRTRPEIDSQTGGIVTWVMSGGSTVRVHWPINISEERLTADLEPDEAPE